VYVYVYFLGRCGLMKSAVSLLQLGTCVNCIYIIVIIIIMVIIFVMFWPCIVLQYPSFFLFVNNRYCCLPLWQNLVMRRTCRTWVADTPVAGLWYSWTNNNQSTVNSVTSWYFDVRRLCVLDTWIAILDFLTKQSSAVAHRRPSSHYSVAVPMSAWSRSSDGKAVTAEIKSESTRQGWDQLRAFPLPKLSCKTGRLRSTSLYSISRAHTPKPSKTPRHGCSSSKR